MNYMDVEFGSRSNGERGQNQGEYSRREHLPYSDDYACPRKSPEGKRQHAVSPISRRVYDDYVTYEYEDKDQESNRYSSPRAYGDSLDKSYGRSGRSRHERDTRGKRLNSRSRSRSREKDSRRYGREHSRHRDNSRESRGRRESPRSRRDESRNKRDDYRKRENSWDRTEREDYRDNYKERRTHELPPSSTIIVQNLTLDATEKDIEELLKKDGVSARTVAIIRERNGESRGFAFVEFDDITTAEKWINLTKRAITIRGHTSSVDYSKSRKAPDVHADWICNICNKLNFGSRVRQGDKRCFKCKALQSDFSQSASELLKLNDNNGNEASKVEPCNVLMLRGMDFSTTEETIRMEIVKLTTKSIYDVRLIKDKVTDMSRGFAFIELGTVEDAQKLLETIEKADPPFEIDHRKIAAGYARHGYNAPLNGKKNLQNNHVSKQTAAENAVAQASATKATAEYSQSMADSYALTGASCYQQVAGAIGQHDKQQQKQQQPLTNYVYDANSGYYYDASTGLYYDPNTGYYYNGTTQEWLYWNGTRYEAVNQDGTPVTKTDGDTQQATGAQNKSESDTVPITGQKPKNARKIAKDMEKWAKKLNNQSEARKIAVKQAQDELRMLEQKEEELRKKISQEKIITGALSQQIQAGKDGVRSLFVSDYDEEGSVLQLGSALTPNKPQKPHGVSLVADIPDDDDDFVDESKLIDSAKLACLLCKRQFPSKENLMKHAQMSQLHKQNLEKYKQSKIS